MFYLHVERPRNCLPEHVSTLSSKWFPGSTTWPWRHTKLYVNLVYSHLDCTWLLQRCVCGCYRLDSRQRRISLSIYSAHSASRYVTDFFSVANHSNALLQTLQRLLFRKTCWFPAFRNATQRNASREFYATKKCCVLSYATASDAAKNDFYFFRNAGRREANSTNKRCDYVQLMVAALRFRMEDWIDLGGLNYIPIPAHRRSPIQALMRQSRPSVEVATCWSRVRCPNHYTTKLH